MLGFYTILNCPTGMGKTLAFYFVLFWHWNIGDTDPANERIVLIIGPLNALMQWQVSAHSWLPISSLTLGIGGDSDACRRALGVINSQTPNKIDAMKVCVLTLYV